MIEIISTFYIKKDEQKNFRDSLETNKKKIDAIMPKGVTYGGMYRHGFGDSFKWECRFILKDSSLLPDLETIRQENEDFDKAFSSYLDTERPIKTYSVDKVV